MGAHIPIVYGDDPAEHLPVCSGCMDGGEPPPSGPVGATCAVCMRQYPIEGVRMQTQAAIDEHLQANWQAMAVAQLTAAAQLWKDKGAFALVEKLLEGGQRKGNGSEIHYEDDYIGVKLAQYVPRNAMGDVGRYPDTD